MSYVDGYPRIVTFLPRTTNNQSEFIAMHIALQMIENYRYENVEIWTDSRLVFESLRGHYSIKHPNVYGIFRVVSYSLNKVQASTNTNIKIKRVSRKLVVEADRAVNEILDEILGSSRAK